MHLHGDYPPLRPPSSTLQPMLLHLGRRIWIEWKPAPMGVVRMPPPTTPKHAPHSVIIAGRKGYVCLHRQIAHGPSKYARKS